MSPLRALINYLPEADVLLLVITGSIVLQFTPWMLLPAILRPKQSIK